MIRSKRWVKDNVVLMGDAKGTAHFSIGAGTKLAMEDSIALFDAFRAKGTVAEALASYETDRREEVERTQHAADVSLVWFEHVDRFWDMDPRQFAFGLMTAPRPSPTRTSSCARRTSSPRPTGCSRKACRAPISRGPARRCSSR